MLGDGNIDIPPGQVDVTAFSYIILEARDKTLAPENTKFSSDSIYQTHTKCLLLFIRCWVDKCEWNTVVALKMITV